MQAVTKNSHGERHEHDVKHILHGHNFACDLARLGGEIVALHVCIIPLSRF